MKQELVKENSGAQSEAAIRDDKHLRYVTEIKLYEKEADKWHTKGKKILRRYKDERSPREESIARFNFLWSNVQTMKPALYAKNPKPNIDRRFKDNDVLSGVTSEILERSATYFVNTDEFGQVMNQVVLDRLLPGRGTAWVRYVPHFKDASIQGNEEVKGEGSQITDDAYPEAEPQQELAYEETVVDYVHWEDSGHNVARTYDEVYLVWRKCFLDRKELIERFGEEKGKQIPLDYTPKDLKDEKVDEIFKKATIYELWNKKDKTACWLHKEFIQILDEQADPLRLKDFFPCPRPLLASTANDTLIPIPDYAEYQDQANELDELTSRISSIKKSLKVAGVYDASAEGVERLLAEGVENQLIPVEQWAAMADKGGLKGVISFIPIQEIAATLLQLYEAREQTKQDLYEISGMSDVMRGATDPDETATAQQIKGQFTSLRLRAQQDEVQRFARDLVRISTQIIAEHFSIETIKEISGIKLLTNAEKQQIMLQQKQQEMMAQQAQATGQQPQPVPPLPEEIQELLNKPTWEEVDQLLKNDALRCFRIDIETDSTIMNDQQQEKADRVEFLASAGNFLAQAMQVGEQQPQLIPLMGEMLKFGVQAFKVSKPLESAFNIAIEKMEKSAQAAENAPQKPDPETVKAQMEMQKMQLEMEKDKQSHAMEMQKIQLENKLATQEMIMNYEIKMKELSAKAQHQNMQFMMKQASHTNAPAHG